MKTSYLLTLSSCIACTVQVGYAQKQEPKKPNLLFIMADQWRGEALGYLGVEPVRTPNIDALAATGVALNNAISNYPVSSPARAMLMTGKYPNSSGVTGNCNSNTAPYGVELKETDVCWSDVLKEQGYSLGYIGKWHLDSPYQPYIPTSNNRGGTAWNEWCPPDRRHGFDYWMAYGTYDAHLKPMYWNTEASRDSFFYVKQWGPIYETNCAIDYLQNKNELRDANNPFALVVSMNPPHSDYTQVPDQYKRLYNDLDVEALCKHPNVPAKGTKMGDHYRRYIRDYYANITGVDEQVGRLIQSLKEQGVYDNTIIVFTSDHGNLIGMHNQVSKSIYYEGSVGIPMIISWKDQLKPRYDDKLLIGLGDLYPTLLSLMGYKDQIPNTVETNDLSKAIVSEKGLYPEYQPYYSINPKSPEQGYRGLRDKRYTFVADLKTPNKIAYLLFDREKDPNQLHNIASEETKLVAKYKKKLYKWLKQTNDPAIELLSESLKKQKRTAELIKTK